MTSFPAATNLFKISRTFLCQQNPRLISSTTILYHNPGLKKKAKIALDQKKMQRQKERQDLRARKQGVSIPIDPDSIPDPTWFHQSRQREIVTLTEQQIEERVLLQKEWAREQMKNHKIDLKMIRDRVKARQDALRELKKESIFLYEEALKLDKDIYPLAIKGPMSTPPLDSYIAPDFVDEKK